jgi:hypothetical protein
MLLLDVCIYHICKSCSLLLSLYMWNCLAAISWSAASGLSNATLCRLRRLGEEESARTPRAPAQGELPFAIPFVTSIGKTWGMPNEICNASLVHGIVSFGLKNIVGVQRAQILFFSPTPFS